MVEEKGSTGRSRASGLCEGGSGPGGTIESSTIKGPGVGRLPITEGCSRPQHNCRDEFFKYGSEGDFHTEFLHLFCRTEICDSKKAAQLGGKVGAESQGLPRALGFTFPVYAEESWSPAWKEPPGVGYSRPLILKHKCVAESPAGILGISISGPIPGAVDSSGPG